LCCYVGNALLLALRCDTFSDTLSCSTSLPGLPSCITDRREYVLLIVVCQAFFFMSRFMQKKSVFFLLKMSIYQEILDSFR